jgi:hypothetical protein
MSIKEDLVTAAKNEQLVAVTLTNTRVYYLGKVLGVSQDSFVFQQVKETKKPDVLFIKDVHSVNVADIDEFDLRLQYT